MREIDFGLFFKQKHRMGSAAEKAVKSVTDHRQAGLPMFKSIDDPNCSILTAYEREVLARGGRINVPVWDSEHQRLVGFRTVG